MSHFFEWDQAKYSVHVPKMDSEHQDIIACMNRLHLQNEAHAPLAQLVRTVDDLVRVTVAHFADEEAYMASIGFPDLGKHKLIHKMLLASVTEHKAKFTATGALSADFFDFLKMWLKAHICGIDIKYSRHKLAA